MNVNTQNSVGYKDIKPVPVLEVINSISKLRGVCLDSIMNPSSLKDYNTRQNLIRTLHVQKGLNDRDIKGLIGGEITEIRNVIRARSELS